MSTEREWYRNLQTGDRAYLIDPDTMRLDRTPHVDVAYHQNEWQKEPGAQPLTDRQIGQIAFAADRALCRMLGLVSKARREWLSLGEEEQMHFSKYGPGAPLQRKELFVAIFAALKGKEIR